MTEVVSATFHFWRPEPGLWITTFWGHPTPADASQLLAAWDAGLQAGHDFVAVADCSRIEVIHGALFQALVEYFQARRALVERLMRKQAMVRPDGMLGMVMAGFYDVLGLGVPVRTFTEMTPALTWLLGREVPAIVQELDTRVARAAGEDPLLRALRSLLVAEPRLDVTGAARRLGRSARTLQRQLRETKTSFNALRGHARVARAQRLLLESDDKITTIALESGCGSLQHFARLFRSHVGQTPQAWRAAHRR